MMNHKIEWLVIYLFIYLFSMCVCVCFFLVKIQKVRQAKLNLYGEYEKKKKSRNFIFNYFFCYLFKLN